MTPVRIGCVVEGHGEVSALPVLLRRLASSVDPPTVVAADKPVRVHRDQFLNGTKAEEHLRIASLRAGAGGGLLVLLDADEDCAKTVGDAARGLADCVAYAHPVVAHCPVCEYESWFLAAAESLRGCRGLPDDLELPGDPEAVRDAKGWLTRNTPRGAIYKEVEDQPAFSAEFCMQLAYLRSPSFRRFCRAFVALLRDLGWAGAAPWEPEAGLVWQGPIYPHPKMTADR